MGLSLKMRCGSRLEEIWEEAHSKCVFKYAIQKPPTHLKTHLCSPYSRPLTHIPIFGLLWIAVGTKYLTLKLILGGTQPKPNINVRKSMHRGKKVRVFLCGDYQFMCHMFGLSGASGMYKQK